METTWIMSTSSDSIFVLSVHTTEPITVGDTQHLRSADCSALKALFLLNHGVYSHFSCLKAPTGEPWRQAHTAHTYMPSIR